LINLREEPFKPGQAVLVREIWYGKIWAARPVIVIQDKPELIALYIPANTRGKRHQNLHGNRVTGYELKNKEWILGDMVMDRSYHYIRLTIPGESFSVIIFWNTKDGSINYWYINLEDPANRIHRTTKGFDCTDQILDVIIEPNLKEWRWEDEEELQEAVEAGVISPEKARALYAKGEEVRDMIMSGKSIFNGWENWKPDPSWEIPVLPAEWDIL